MKEAEAKAAAMVARPKLTLPAFHSSELRQRAATQSQLYKAKAAFGGDLSSKSPLERARASAFGALRGRVLRRLIDDAATAAVSATDHIRVSV